MTTLPFTDTFTQADGSAPAAADWTVTSGTCTVQSNALRAAPAATGQYAPARVDLTGMPVTDATDLTGTVVKDTAGVDQYAVVSINSDGSNTTGDSGNNSYSLLFKYTAGQIALRTLISGTSTEVATANVTLTGTTTYSFRLQRVGNQLRGKVWTGAEPATWTATATLSGTPLTGRASLAAVNGSNSTSRPATFDNITVTNSFAAAYAGTGTLTASAVPAGSTGLGYSGAGTLTSSSAPAVTAAAGYTGAGTVTATGSAPSAASVSYGGTGTLASTGTPAISQTASYSGTGGVGTNTSPAPSGTAGYTSTGTLTSTGKPAIAASTAYTGTGALTTATPGGRLRYGAITIQAAYYGTIRIPAIYYGGVRYPV